MAWDDNDEPLPDMAPILRSVSSLVMSVDPEDGMSATSPHATATAGRNRGTNNMVGTCNSGSSSSSAAERATTQSGAALGSNALEMLMAPLPPTLMDNTCLTREPSFPPPFGRPRFGRDPSFPPPVQVGGGGGGGLTAVDILPSAPSLRNTWSQVGRSIAASTETPCSSGGGTTTMAGGGVYAAGGGGGGGGPSLSSDNFQGLGFLGTGGGGGGGGRLGAKQERQWENDNAGDRDHGGGGTGGRGLSDEDHQADYHPDDIIGGILPSSRPRRPSFDKLAAMIPGIPHWPVPPSPSSSPPAPSSSPSAGELSGELHAPSASGGGGGGSAKAKQQAQFPLRTKTPLLSPPAPAAPAAPSSRGRQPKITRADKKPKKKHHHNPTADSPTTAPWTAPTPPSPAVAAAASMPPKKTPSSGNGKRALETPLSCGPARAGGGPVDLAKQERRRVKIQRYLYKRSRRKFAKSTRDASPSRSRPKAALLRPRVKGKFVKTTPDFVSVNAGGPPQREDGGGDGLAQWEPTDMLPGNMNNALSPKPQVAAGGVGGGRRCGGVGGGGGSGGVRSVRNGGSVNIIFDISKKPFSTTPSSSLMPKGGVGSILPPRAVALSPAGAPNAFAWSARPV
ncbi:unnamed protein product [Ectocarpus sp. CCAP 1310/34]|nr:unnamed protein product [Ectocarpus sp. CCAP 1310/34]